MADRPLTNAEFQNLANQHRTHAIVAAGSHEGINQFLTVVTVEGLQELATSGRITQRQRDQIVQRATFPESTPSNQRRYIVTFEGPDAGHLTATRAFSAGLYNHTSDDDKVCLAAQFRTLNLTVDNPSAQLVSGGAASHMYPYPFLLLNVRNGDITGRENASGFMNQARNNRYAMNTSDPNMAQALVQATGVPLAPLSGARQGVETTEAPFGGAPQIPNKTFLS